MTMDLVTIDVPCPRSLRGGWAALAAVVAARGLSGSVFANESQWHYHDGGGNWACLRFQEGSRAVMVGHDHEYSETYFGKSAEYFGEKETDLLLGAPKWWGENLDPKPFGEWIGFVYGWDGEKWQRAVYGLEDGFRQVGLVKACLELDLLFEFSKGAPGLSGGEPDREALQKLVDAGAEITEELLEDAVPGWEVELGAEAARKFALVAL